MKEKVKQEVVKLFQDAYQNINLSKVKISGPLDSTKELKSIAIKLVEIKSGLCFQFVYENKTNNVTKNYTLENTVTEVITLLDAFKNISFITRDYVYQYDPKPEKIRRHTNKNTTINKNGIDLSHDNHKKHIVVSNKPYLETLGISTSSGNVKKKKTDKFKQINRYIEILSPLIAASDLGSSYKITDMGSGKGYLTFALYDYLKNDLGHTPSVTGIEIRNELVTHCNQVANDLNFEQLSFESGYIGERIIEDLDVLIALHACDTATDEAIAAGINASAKLIVCSPCCHKQIRKDMNAETPLNSISKYGIMKERQAELVTDAIRTLILEYYGYKTKVIEFIKTAHTPKNLLLVGVKHRNTKDQGKLKEINDLKKIFGIGQHHLEKTLSLNLNEQL